MKKQILHCGIKVDHIRADQYCLYWVDADGQNAEHITSVYGFENAVRVANGIAFEQAEFVTHPGFSGDQS